MLILKIFFIVLLILILFLVFLPNRFEIKFANKIWEIRFENLFFMCSFGTNGINFDFFLKFKPKEEKQREQEEQVFDEETIIYKPETAKSKSQKVEKESSKISQETTEPVKKKREKISKKSEIRQEEELFDEKPEKSTAEWINLVKDVYKKEKKLIKSFLRYVVRVIKLSLKLLTPAKINLNVQGGFDDPAETGWFCSIFILFNSFFENNKQITLDFTPDFVQKKWEANGEVIYRFSIAKLIFFVLLLLVCIPYFQIIKSLWRNRNLILIKHK